MIQLFRVALILLVATCAFASPAIAQPRRPMARGFFVVNGAYQATTNDFDKASGFQANAEDGTFTTEYDLSGGLALDVAGGVTVWRRFAVGVGITRFSRSTPAALNGSVPHPFSFNQHRAVSGPVPGLKREELAVHAQARAIVPVGHRFQLMVFGGPSFFQVKQGMVSSFTWSESYPFDAAMFAGGTTAAADGSRVGFNGGADLAYFFSSGFGLGGSILFSGATVGVENTGVVHDVKAGGTTAGGGLRLRF